MNALTKIMIVEDDDNIREIEARILFKLGGFEVTACRSGQEALEVVSSSKPQLILLDVMMPGMDGHTTLKKLKENNKIPVVFITARVQHQQIEEYQKEGVIGVISKPFDPMMLVDTINAIWSQTQDSLASNDKDTKINLSDDSKAELLELYQSFAKDLPIKISDIIERWTVMRSKDWNSNEWQRFFLDVHKLCGSTGTFGYNELCKTLIKMEQLLNTFREIQPMTQSLDEISALVEELRVVSKKNTLPKPFWTKDI